MNGTRSTSMHPAPSELIAGFLRCCAVPAAVLAATPAVAAEVTDMPPELGGSGQVIYSGATLHGNLEETGVVISGRSELSHDVGVRLEGSPVKGFAVTLGLDARASGEVSYPGARTMILDPLTGSGTYLPTQPGEDGPTYRTSGLEGLWFGAALAPFSETYAQRQLATWRLDVAVRTGSKKHNLWIADADGNRGASLGSAAFKLAGAFSADYGLGNPYLTATWIKETKATVDATDAFGELATKDLVVRPASTIDAVGGIELVAYRDPKTAERAALDLHVGFGYRAWQDVPTGVYLPNVLDLAAGVPVTTGDSVHTAAGLGFAYHADDYACVRTGVEVRYASPYSPEHVYPVHTTADTWEIGWTFSVLGFYGVGERTPQTTGTPGR